MEELDINWPSNLIEELAYNRGIIFIGAGVSATAKDKDGKRLPGWEETIGLAKGLVKPEFVKLLGYVDTLLDNEEYLGALQVIQDHSDSGAYSALMRNTFKRGSFSASKAHELLMKLNMKIVVSTNFDSIYEDYCRSMSLDVDAAYAVSQYYQEQSLISNIKSFQNVIIKAHGSIDEIDKMVFTRNQFFKAKNSYPHFYKLLEALFLTHTVLFIGYSLKDPDIQLLLNSAINTLSPEAPHYILIKENEVHSEIEKMWKENYNISVLKYPTSEEAPHKYFIPAINDLYNSIVALRSERGLTID